MPCGMLGWYGGATSAVVVPGFSHRQQFPSRIGVVAGRPPRPLDPRNGRFVALGTSILLDFAPDNFCFSSLAAIDSLRAFFNLFSSSSSDAIGSVR